MDIGLRRRAYKGDLERLHGLLAEASSWLRQKGVAQWNSVYPLDRFAREVASGCVWYWTSGDEPIATVTLYGVRPDYYPSGVWEDETAAWYVCRLAVARRYGGRDMGTRLLDSLERDGAAAGIQALRLDVVMGNEFLEGYYRSRGFERYQLVEMFGEPCALLERTIGRE